MCAIPRAPLEAAGVDVFFGQHDAMATLRAPLQTQSAHLVLVLLLAIVPYGNAVQAGFTFDDAPQLRTNPAVSDGIDLLRIVSTPLPPGNLFRPLTVLTFAINERLTPGAPGLFHVVNIALHAAVSVLVYRLAQRLLESNRAAVISAALFAVHPVHTEAVTSLVGRAEILAALCGLGSLLTAMMAMGAPERVTRLWLEISSLVLFSLAIVSKESGLTVFPMILLARIAMRRETLMDGVRRELSCWDWVPYVLCALIFLVWRAGVTLPVTTDPLDNPLVVVPLTVRMRTALGILWDYFGLLHVPGVLSADYSYNQVPIVSSWWAPRFWAGLGLVLCATLYLAPRRWSGLAVAIVFPLVTLSLTANVLFPIGTIKAERLLYLPSVGWALTYGWLFHELLSRPRYRSAAALVLAVLTAAFAIRTWVRNRDWHDNAALYASMVRTAPRSAKAHYNFGVALQDQGEIDAARAQFRQALEISPWGENPAVRIGIGFELEGQRDTALEWYRKALDIAPASVDAHTNVCRLRLSQDRFDEANRACRRGLRYEPSNANLLKGVGESLIGQGEIRKGIAVLRRSLALNQQDEPLRIRIAELETMTDHQSGTVQ